MEDGMSVKIDFEPTVGVGLPEADPEHQVTESDAAEADRAPRTWAGRAMMAPRSMILFGLAIVVALAILVCLLGFRVHQSQQAQTQRSQLLQVARQGALNLTTIDWQHADADVHRILDGATGEFYNDFSKRSQPFIEVLQQAKATTVGTVTEAGLESQTADTAQALVAVSVQTSNAGENDPVPRVWRMRITVQKVGDQVKVSNVGFVA
jgi:Mce-associated membrane protein